MLAPIAPWLLLFRFGTSGRAEGGEGLNYTVYLGARVRGVVSGMKPTGQGVVGLTRTINGQVNQ